jgi:hypothetical protein
MKIMRQGLGALGLGLCVMGASCYGSCFVRGTRILTPRGLRRIEDLAVGDEVYSLDVETRRPVVRVVGRVLRAQATEILHIAAGELRIAGVTSEHPFYDAEREAWIPAGEVREGTRLVAWLGASDVRTLEVTAHRRAPSAGKVEVFNLTIDGPEHNYFAEGLLVHNKDIPAVGDPLGQPCASDADCEGGENLVCDVSTDGACGSIERLCHKAVCGAGPLQTVCGCDGKPHATANCTGSTRVQVDKRPGACTPPAGMYNCGDGTCATGAQYCLEGFSEIKCVDLPPSCTGADASCACLEAAGVASCGCVVGDGGIRVAGCQP